MDVLKVLTRSTKLQKSAPASTEGKVPSAGLFACSQPDSLHHSGNASIIGRSEGRGTKRKRNPDTEQANRQSSRPGFLPGQGSGNRLTPSGSKTVNAAPLLGEEDCRRTFRQNKLKVTILQGLKGGEDEVRGAREIPGDKLKKQSHIQIWPQPLVSFKLLRDKYGISRRLMENLKAQGYSEPTQVQIGCLPILLGSDEDIGLDRSNERRVKKYHGAEVDFLTIAPTGSGKTLGFMIHLIHGVLHIREASKKEKVNGILEQGAQALILAPTHELVDQIINEGKKLALGTGVKVSGLRKGTRLQSVQVNDRGKTQKPHEGARDDDDSDGDEATGPVVKADIIVSTPLQLMHSISTTHHEAQSLLGVRFLVLDEADVLLDSLFREQTLAVWEACSHPSLRISLWSATIGSSIESLAQAFIMSRRRKLNLSTKHHYIIRLVIGLKDSAIPQIRHRLVYAASEQGKLLALRQILHPSTASSEDTVSLQPPFLVFTQTISRAVALHSELLYDIPVEAGGSPRIAVLHSDLSDTARSNIMAGFRKGEIWILITTDLLSRGVDFRGMNGVVNYDIPTTGASYVHRAGRTGRQGREGGIAITLYSKEDIPYVKNVANVIASSERANQKKDSHEDGDGKGMQKWLLDALPNVSKKTKKVLKRKGVESRSVPSRDDGGKETRKMRISTKSGYDRRLENKKKGVLAGNRRKPNDFDVEQYLEDNEWGGIDD